MPTQRQRLHEEIAAWAAEHAGTSLDLDKDLEQAGLEAIEEDRSSWLPARLVESPKASG
jgi:hypothetical protein